MEHPLISPPKARPGDRVAVVSPSFAAPGFAPAVHEQAMRRLAEVTGLVPVEYPTTRQLGASPEDRARDLNAAFADPEIRAVVSTVGGEDQITVIGHLDADAMRADSKPFLGYSDNTNLHQWLWAHGVQSFYGGSTQVHLGPGPAVDAVHAASLRAALLTGERLEITEPGESEDHGVDWLDPRALSEFGEREPVPGPQDDDGGAPGAGASPWRWAGPRRVVTGRTWGGCLEVLPWVMAAGRGPADVAALEGGVLLIETSEELPSAGEVRRLLRILGERGMLGAVDAVLAARPPTSSFEVPREADERARLRAEQADVVVETVATYNPDAVVCVGVPFGHTRPQWVLPHGGVMTVDGAQRRVWAEFG
ncbi:LD-carboxypeptidase [Micrococcus flavus]|uniref:Muramoyltetrapeptide carboxypeptidase LdcA involved in peptidoglycan recycling n=1 Tax=Micrococcus flavus TaxID=384602 RepID=A0A4Y8X2J8_9MICC|nr:S66 peptidase family protein [Micrococcus flavus]MBB4881823.1 muramoyltetrapeptide carboxypeptidase LdcA involved in peptidoglycan recycling [Micrococcus flavus]TFI03625.1 LD-carboxypeptidase [Micrococcus flavus]GGK45122.1 LD-carboxypeptidase [Micrococcus flavus]